MLTKLLYFARRVRSRLTLTEADRRSLWSVKVAIVGLVWLFWVDGVVGLNGLGSLGRV